MKKIPTLFVRKFVDGKCVGITDKVTPGMEWVLEGEGVATLKYDGVCCAIIGGALYKRYDAKHGKTPPEGAIPCCAPDPVTGHWPHWVPVDPDNPADKWFMAAYNLVVKYGHPHDGTWEAVGTHFNGNHHNLRCDTLIEHGVMPVDVERSFDGIRQYLTEYTVEGLVFWRGSEPMCKIKRTDFGLPWPVKVETSG